MSDDASRENSESPGEDTPLESSSTGGEDVSEEDEPHLEAPPDKKATHGEDHQKVPVEEIPDEKEEGEIVERSMFAGPLPPPSILRKYNEIVPEGAERIMSMAEREQRHRHDLNEKDLEGRYRILRTGQWLGFILGLVGLVCGTFLLYYNRNLGGFGVLLLGVGSIVASLLFRGDGPSSDDISSDESSEDLPQKE